MITAVPTITAQGGCFMLRVASVEPQRAWQKGYGNEKDAYADAVDIELALEEYPDAMPSAEG